ncbi:MAG: cytochrome c biogenesis protein CcsA [Azoarcus sp.]|nr:cytochrome c biogenesis protein CcsA [Azoarcus sp.]
MPDRRDGSGRWHAAAVFAATALCSVVWPTAGRLLVAFAAILVVGAIPWGAMRVVLLRSATAMLWGGVAALAWHLLTDQFMVRYVWLYSAAALPAHLKFANLWGGDEGTMLLLAALCASLAARTRLERPGALEPTVIITACYVVTAAWLDPFAATPGEWLASAPSQGMNAHLMTFWMLLHAPLILIAYAWILFLAAPAAGTSVWPAGAVRSARRAWAALTGGIGFGMIWAFEDATYGQVWHWDPVQTSVFAVWCFLTAVLHGAGRSRSRMVSAAAFLAAASAAMAMAVTRSEVLASSHRYVGADSWVSHLVLAGVLAVLGILHLRPAQEERSRRRPRARPSAAELGLALVRTCFVIAGLLALSHVAAAFAGGLLGLPRAEALKPFFATLSNWTGGAELAGLRRAFSQWDVDGYALARALLLPLTSVGVLGGWYFFRRLSPRAGLVALGLALLGSAYVWARGGYLSEQYRGAGVLSQQIVGVLPLIDASLLAGAFLALGSFVWGVRGAWRGTRGGTAYVLPLALLHVGVVLALWGGVLSTVLNTYSQQVLVLDDAPGEWTRDAHGYLFRIRAIDVDRRADGGFVGKEGHFRSIAQVELNTPSKGPISGQALYRDTRSPLAGYSGPVRQICEVLDYRYARFASSAGYVLHPFTDHDWGRAIQVWVSPAAAVAALDSGSGTAEAVVVVRVFPFSSLLWSGLVLMVLSAVWLGARPRGAAFR